MRPLLLPVGDGLLVAQKVRDHARKRRGRELTCRPPSAAVSLNRSGASARYKAGAALGNSNDLEGLVGDRAWSQ